MRSSPTLQGRGRSAQTELFHVDRLHPRPALSRLLRQKFHPSRGGSRQKIPAASIRRMFGVPVNRSGTRLFELFCTPSRLVPLTMFSISPLFLFEKLFAQCLGRNFGNSFGKEVEFWVLEFDRGKIDFLFCASEFGRFVTKKEFF